MQKLEDFITDLSMLFGKVIYFVHDAKYLW
jgi:hypothetical protein